MPFRYNPITGQLDMVQSSATTGDTSQLILVANCTASESVGDAVYIFGDGEVRKADASSITTSRVAGFIKEKPSSTTCKIILSGSADIFTGLTVGSSYFLSETPGQISTTPPTALSSVVSEVGKALTVTKLLIGLSNIYTIRT